MHGNLNVKFEKRMFVLRCTRWEVRILSPSIMSLLQLRTIMYTWRHWLPIAMRRNERATSVGTQAFIFSDTSYVFSSDCPVTFVLSFIPEIFKVSPAYSVNFLFKSIPQTLQCIKVQKRKKGREAYFFTTLLTASVVDERNMKMEHCWNESDRENQSTRGPELT